jgi:plasmid stabilization system protein ParE
MTYTLAFLPAVEADVLAGRVWYEDKSPGLGEEFLRVFYACTQAVARNPMAYQRVHRDLRRCLLRRFPYAVYSRVVDDCVVVFGVFHCARDPHRVGRELGDRGL